MLSKFINSIPYNPGNIGLHRITLSFLDENIEKDFLDDYFDNSLNYIRVSILVGIFIYAIYSILDALVFPEIMVKLWLIRGVTCFIFVTVIAISFSPHFKQYIQIYLSAIIVIAGIGLITMVAIAPPPLNYAYYAGLILVFIFGYTFVKARFVAAAISGTIIVVLYEATGLWIDTPKNVLINNSFIFIGGNVMGMYACYSIEYYTRSDFFSGLQLRRANKELAKANENKDRRVAELKLLNNMSDSLNNCRAEKDTHSVLKHTCNALFPDDSGYVLFLDNSETKLEKAATWGSSPIKTELFEFDKCKAFSSGEKQFVRNMNDQQPCPQLIPPHSDYLCVPIKDEKEKTRGVFHLSFGKDKSNDPDEECEHLIESKHALAVRMIEQYSLFLINLRQRIMDPQTDLYNHIYIMESLEKEISQFKFSGVIMLDIDDFRGFNEKHGNEIGDKLLKEFGQFLKKIFGNMI